MDVVIWVLAIGLKMGLLVWISLFWKNKVMGGLKLMQLLGHNQSVTCLEAIKAR